MGEEAEEVKFAQVDCVKSFEVCQSEALDEYPQIYMYKDGDLEDIFDGDRNIENLANFVWEHVDPSRVEERDGTMEGLMMMQNLMGGIKIEEEGEEEEEEMEEEEEEECDCSEPDCDCGDEEDYAEDNEEEDEEEEEEELSDEDIAHIEKAIRENKKKKEDAKVKASPLPKEGDIKRDEL